MTEKKQQSGHGRTERPLNAEIRSLDARVGELEHALGRSQDMTELCRAFIDNVVQGLAIVQDKRFVFTNPAMENITGYSTEQLLAMSPDGVEALIHPDDHQASLSCLRDCLAGTNAPDPHEIRVVRKDGGIRQLQLYASRITHHGRDAVQAAYVDITDYRHTQTQEISHISTQRMSSAFNHAAIGMAFVALDGRLIKVNPAIIQLLGYTEEELSTKSFQDLTHPDDLQTDLDFVRQMLAGDIITY